jgi:hypothetical protein
MAVKFSFFQALESLRGQTIIDRVDYPTRSPR